jgi:hypothetical protein
MTMLVSAAEVRTYLNDVSITTSDQYSAATIGSNILAAQSVLEQLTGRYLAPRTFTAGNPWIRTTMLAAQVPLPGFLTLTTITWGGATLVPDQSCWLIPDAMQTGLYTGLQFRAFRSDAYGLGIRGTPYGPWIANQNWFDQYADSPFYPGNPGGGSFFSSMPNDLRIVGVAGFDPTVAFGDPGAVPYAVLHAIKVLASFYTMRPASLLADVAITPQGGVLTYSQLPAEVRDFVASWKAGQTMMVST